MNIRHILATATVLSLRSTSRYALAAIAIAGYVAAYSPAKASTVDFNTRLDWAPTVLTPGGYATGCTGSICVDPTKIGNGAAYLASTLSDQIGTTYTLSFGYNSNYTGVSPDTPNELKVVWNSEVLFDLVNLNGSAGILDPYGTGAFDPYTITVTGTGKDVLAFFGRQDPGDLAIDNVTINTTVSAVPLPGAVGLLGTAVLALSGFAGLRHRKLNGSSAA